MRSQDEIEAKMREFWALQGKTSHQAYNTQDPLTKEALRASAHGFDTYCSALGWAGQYHYNPAKIRAKLNDIRAAQAKVVSDVDEQQDPLIRQALRTACEALGTYVAALVWVLEESAVQEG